MVKNLNDVQIARHHKEIALMFTFNLDAQNGPAKTAAIGQVFKTDSRMLEIADTLENMARNIRLLEKRLK